MSHYRKNIQLAGPVVIGQLGHVMVGVADSIMVGKLGTLPLAAAALGNSLFVIFMVFGMGMAYGLTPLVANADGMGRKNLPVRLLQNGFWINLATGGILFLLMLALIPFFPFMGQDPGILPMAGSYFSLIASSVVPLMMFMLFKQFAEGLSATKAAMGVSLFCNVLNIFLNYLLIYGNWGFPALGVNGAGLATLISRVLMFLVMWYFISTHKRFQTFKWKLFPIVIHKKIARRILSIGVPTGMQYIFEVSAFSLAAVFAGLFGASALASHQIAISLASVSYMAATGLGAAATVRVGNQLGRRDIPTLRKAANSLFIMTLIWMSFTGLILLIFRYQLIGFYSSDPEVLALSAKMLIVAVIFQLSDGLQAVGLGALRGLTDVRVPTYITFFAYWVITLPAAYLVSQYTPAGPMGIWYCLAGGLTISAALLLIRFYREVGRRER